MSIEQGTMELKKPAVYQMVNGERREVAGNYVLRGKDRVAFDVAGYDPGQALIIDPVLDYSTYLGGSSSTTAGDIAYGIAVDASGDAYVTGLTYSTPFPTSSSPATIEGYQAATAAGAAVANGTAFVSEIDPTGTTELYFSYLSGSTSEAGYGIAVDPAPNANCPNGVAPGICVYVTGYTASTDFPVTSGANAAFDPGPPTGSYTGFISKLNPAASGASSLVYSSYLGGSAGDSGNAIAVDANQVAYVAGITTSSPGAAPDDFVLVNPYQNTLNSSSGNAFLVKVDTTAGAGALKYATYLGGSGVNSGTLGFGHGAFGVAVDSSQNAYIVGTTSSTDFPTIGNAVEATAPTGNTQGTAFVSRIDTTQTGNPSPSLIYSTYLGGSVKEHGDAIALGPNNVVYVTGASSSTSTTGTGSPTPFPVTTGAYQTTGSPAGVVFVSLIDTNAVSPASSLKYSTLLGGSGADEGFGIKADSLGNAYVAGVAQSAGAPPSGFPTTPGAYQTTRPNVLGDVFVAKLDPAGNGSADLLYSSYFGGSGSASGIQDQAYAVAIDLAGNAYLAGQTASADFPIYPASAFQSSFVTGNLYGFAAKLTLEPTVAISPLTIPFGNQAEGIASAPQTVTLTNNTSSAAAITLPLAAITGANAGDFSATPAASGSTAACTSSLAAGSSCAIEVTFTPSITGTLESGTLSITYTAGASSNPAFTQTIGLSGTGIVVAPGATVMPASPLTFSGQLVTTTSAAQPVTVTNSGNSDLTFSAAPAISGTNSGDFAISSTTCSTSTPVTAGNSCTINITFTPPTGAAGARTATLTIADNAAGSPQTETLNGTAWDFGLSAQSTTVGASGTASIPVTITSLGGFTGGVTLSCTSNIPHSTCAGPGTSVTAPGTGNVTITTNAFLVPSSPEQTPPVSPRQIMLGLLALMLLLLFCVARRTGTRLGLAGAAVLFVVLAGCANTPPTPAGQYTVTITGTSGGASHQTTANVTVR
jgi:Beta-propeller repeat/Cep192 domain 4